MIKDRGITFTPSIIKQVAEKLGLTEKEVQEVYYQVVAYMDYSVKNTPTSTIDLPVLGYMFINIRHIKNKLTRLQEVQKLEPTNEVEFQIEATKKQIDDAEILIQELRNKKVRLPIIAKSIEKKLYAGFKRKDEEFSWEEVETRQNK